MSGSRVPSGVLVVTDRRQASVPLVDVVAAAVAGGARWVLLREKDLPAPERARLAQRLRQVLAPVDGELVVAGPDPLGGDAVHLAASDPMVRAGLVGRSCHGPAELAQLTIEDYVTVSPVFASASKPGYGPPWGAAELARLVPLAGRPVLALGGVETPERVAACRRAGVHGVAVMGAVMRAPDPAVTVTALRNAFDQAVAFEREVPV